MDWKSERFKPVFQGLIILLIGLAGGILFDRLGISAGFFMGCMLFSGFYRFVVKSEIALTGIYNQLGQIIFGMLIRDLIPSGKPRDNETGDVTDSVSDHCSGFRGIFDGDTAFPSDSIGPEHLDPQFTPGRPAGDDQSGGGFEAECRNRSGRALFSLNDYRPDHALADAFSWPA